MRILEVRRRSWSRSQCRVLVGVEVGPGGDTEVTPRVKVFRYWHRRVVNLFCSPFEICWTFLFHVLSLRFLTLPFVRKSSNTVYSSKDIITFLSQSSSSYILLPHPHTQRSLFTIRENWKRKQGGGWQDVGRFPLNRFFIWTRIVCPLRFFGYLSFPLLVLRSGWKGGINS